MGGTRQIPAKWWDLCCWGFSRVPVSVRCRAIPGYTSLDSRKLTQTSSWPFSRGVSPPSSLRRRSQSSLHVATHSSLPEFERKSQGSVRGDAKKFALERAADFITRFGLPEEFVGVEEPESRFKEVRLIHLSLGSVRELTHCSFLAQQIYNWFKNTVGRTRRKLEGRPRSAKKAAEKGGLLGPHHGRPSGAGPLRGPSSVGPGVQGAEDETAAAVALASDLAWATQPSAGYTPHVTGVNVSVSVGAESPANSPINPAQTLLTPSGIVNYGPLQPSTSMTGSLSSVTVAAGSQQQQQQQQQQQPQHNLSTLTLGVTQITMRESFLQGLDPTTMANMITSFVAANPSPTPLTPIVDALFEAISAANADGFGGDHHGLSHHHNNPHGLSGKDPHLDLQRFLDATRFLPENVVHAGAAGALSGPRALQMHIRRASTWIPHAPPRSTNGGGMSRQANGVVGVGVGIGPNGSSLSSEMQRIAADRQRRRDYIQWAKIHAAALEMNIFTMGRVSEGDNTMYAYALGRSFSEMMARDCVWDSDEVEWVAGIYVLRAIIRTAMRGDRRQRDEYDELLRTYEDRWKEIKDEARQALVTVSFFFSMNFGWC